MKVHEWIRTRFEIEDGDTLAGISQQFLKAPRDYLNTPIRVVGDGVFEFEHPLQ